MHRCTTLARRIVNDRCVRTNCIAGQTGRFLTHEAARFLFPQIILLILATSNLPYPLHYPPGFSISVAPVPRILRTDTIADGSNPTQTASSGTVSHRWFLVSSFSLRLLDCCPLSSDEFRFPPCAVVWGDDGMKICCPLMIIRDIAAASYYNTNIALLRYEVVGRPVIVIVSSQLLGMCWPLLHLRDPSQNGRILPSHADGYIRPAGPQAAPATKKTRRRRKERGTLREGEIGTTERRFILRPAAQIMYGRVPEFLYAHCGITSHPKAFLGGSVWDDRMHAHARDTLTISVKHTALAAAGDERTHAGREKEAVLHLVWELPCSEEFSFASSLSQPRTTSYSDFKAKRTAHSADRTRAEKIPRLEAADRDAMPMRRSHPRTTNSAQTFYNTVIECVKLFTASPFSIHPVHNIRFMKARAIFSQEASHTKSSWCVYLEQSVKLSSCYDKLRPPTTSSNKLQSLQTVLSTANPRYSP
ncbi:uncharacterized protein CLUP02_06584 [Colletotrichum lupini]|uniref:Uncharacterized protein n=1 Tax=Colletotrichum lupini TaxID=145971 RepID=A0A9Q8WET1_9PEZI|nr:uncharacterized protein CLUP02_06584 [Colletotrichum lupini]UQC81098.1 hypothetical protein CLUP02_06584 [Colletotrichum lupini]